MSCAYPQVKIHSQQLNEMKLRYNFNREIKWSTVSKSKLALSVDGIAVTGPTDCQMSHSISIGDDRERLEQQYHGVINAEYSNDQQLSLGNQMPYWGVIYFFEEGKLVGMYNGSMAE